MPFKTDDIEPAWKACESEANCSFFQSWAWTSEFLHIIEDRVPVSVLEIRQGNDIAGISLLCSRRIRRHGFVTSRTLFLNQAGIPELDQVTIEHNGLLARSGHEAGCIQSLFGYLHEHRHEWDEVVIAGVSGDLDAYLDPSALNYATIHPEVKPFYFVDLENVRSSGNQYLDILSSNTRYQARRATRIYSNHGTPALDVAGNTDQAMEYLDALIRLHQAYWKKKGHPGAFSNQAFTRFQRELIRSCFDAGNIQLLRVTSGSRTIGYLYNYVYRGHVYSYQSGFEYGDKHEKPGLVSHLLAIEYNISAGMRTYDFLAGESQYKQSLCTGKNDMVWLTYRQPRLQFTIEDYARRLKDSCSAFSGRIGRHAGNPGHI